MMNSSAIDSKLDPESFADIAELAYRECGLQLVVEKTSMIQSRLRNRLAALGLHDFRSYSKFVCSPDGAEERRHMISALTTNVSHFFRENHHFERLTDTILPNIEARLASGGKLRIWSAGCSNGQEAVSIAISILERLPHRSNCDVKILASDIDSKVVAFAREGKYSERMLNGVSPTHLSKYFDRSSESGETIFTIKQCVSDLIRYKELNLLSQWPMAGSFDVIFCRNVLIYFDAKTQNQLWPRFLKMLTPEGYLFIGHSERIPDPEAFGYFADGPTCYRPRTSTNLTINNQRGII